MPLRKRNKHVVAACNESSDFTNRIHPSFFEDFVAPVCKEFQEPYACIENIRIPTYDVQQKMIEQLQDIQTNVDIRQIYVYVVKLIWSDQMELLDELITSVHQYHDVTEHIRNLLELV